MDRKTLHRSLVEYDSTYVEELGYRVSMLNLLNHFPNCFDRSCAYGHFTGSAWILNQDFSKVLLLHHKKLNRWLQPGGHADGVENLSEVAIKEAKEETGLANFIHIQATIYDLDVHLIPKRNDVPAHYHFDVRTMMIADDANRIIENDESNEIRWVRLNDVIDLVENNQSIMRMINKSLKLDG